MSLLLFILQMSVLKVVSTETAGRCRFARELRDTWYDGSLGSVVIGGSSITHRGACVSSHADKYLIENKKIGCYSCLHIVKRHPNVLQYQESFCGAKASLQQVCSNLGQGTIWRTLFRENFSPSQCPFRDAYHFSYSNNTGGVCRSPMSYAESCAGEAHYRLHYKHCSGPAYTYDMDVDLNCIGSWEWGEQNYLAVKLQASNINDKQQQYRCIVYKVLGTLLYVAMSADASCQGLQTARDGPVVMQMTRDVLGWKAADCEYPHWFNKDTWRDLSGHILLHSNNENNSIHQLYRDDVIKDAPAVTQKAFHCQDVTENWHKNGVRELTVLTFASRDCSSAYQCIRIKKRRDDVLEFIEGNIRIQSNPNPCTETDFMPSNTSTELPKTILIPDSTVPDTCPTHGKYLIRTGSDICKSYLRSSCNVSHPSVIDIKSTCSSKPGMQLVCLKSWRENSMRYLIARQGDDDYGPANCFSFRKVLSGLQFTVDSVCNAGVPYIVSDTVFYTLDEKPMGCEEQVEHPSIILRHPTTTLNNIHIEPFTPPIQTDTRDKPRVHETRKTRDHQTQHAKIKSAAVCILSPCLNTGIIYVVTIIFLYFRSYLS